MKTIITKDRMNFENLSDTAKEFAILDEIKYLLVNNIFPELTDFYSYIERENIERELQELSDNGDYWYNSKGERV